MAVYSPYVQYTCTTRAYVRPLPPLERAIFSRLCAGPASPQTLATALSTPLPAINRAIVELLRRGLITLASDKTAPRSAGSARRCPLPRIRDDDSCCYSATALHSARPLTSLESELLRACRTPMRLQALAACTGLSVVTVVWLLQGLARHGLIREGGAA